MIIKIHKQLLLTSLISLMLWGCGSSPEYTTAKMSIEKANWVQAEEYLVKALEAEPDNPEIPIQLGYHIYAKQGNWVQMNEMFERALSMDPDAKILTGRPVSEFVEQYRNMFWAEKYNKGVGDYNKYRQSRDKADLQSAITAFKESGEINPNEGQSFSILATSYLELGQNDLAIQNGKKAVEVMPNDFHANFALSQILSRLGQKEESLPYGEKAADLDPSNSNAIRQLATLYYELNEKEKSVETFEKAIKTETDKMLKSDLYFNLGVLNMQLNNFQDAEDSFMSAYDLNPEDIEALAGMAQTFENAEKWRRASKFYRECIALDPENPDHYKGMARVLIQQGRPEEATRYYEKAKARGG